MLMIVDVTTGYITEEQVSKLTLALSNGKLEDKQQFRVPKKCLEQRRLFIIARRKNDKGNFAPAATLKSTLKIAESARLHFVYEVITKKNVRMIGRDTSDGALCLFGFKPHHCSSFAWNPHGSREAKLMVKRRGEDRWFVELRWPKENLDMPQLFSTLLENLTDKQVSEASY